MVSKGMVKRFLETRLDLAEKIPGIVAQMEPLDLIFPGETLTKLFGDSALSQQFWTQYETDDEMKKIGLREAGIPA